MRQVFLPMSFIYSHRFSFPPTPLTRQLRKELYPHAYDAMSFGAYRNSISPRDNYHPKTALLNSLNWILVNIHEPLVQRTGLLKQRAEDWVYTLIQQEDQNSDYACLGPVNAPMNMLACYIREGPESYAVKRHAERLHDFLWMNQEGMMMNGTNGVQVWDTAWLIQAVVEAGLAEDPKWRPMLTRALEFLEDQQIREDCPETDKYYRQRRKGAWPFSTRDQGYTVSDCTSEALKAVMMLQSLPGYSQMINKRRMCDAVDILLTMQNSTGGFASYEPTRGSSALLEQLNAAEVFGRIMVEYDYPECTTAVITALRHFNRLHPAYRSAEIHKAVEDATEYMRVAQAPDGSWYGSWGICFTYAAMFALESLRLAGETYATSERVRRGCQFLIDHQDTHDGGWGESYQACEDSAWRNHPDGSQVVQTAWAAIALMEADYPDQAPIQRALALIVKRQQAQGDWAQEGIEGVFNKSWYVYCFPFLTTGPSFRRALGYADDLLTSF